MRLFTSYSASELDVVRATKELFFRPVAGSEQILAELLLTEDLLYWRNAIEAQPDCERISDYRYAYVISIEFPAGFVQELLTSSTYGRISAGVADMFERLGREGPAPVLGSEEADIFVLQGIDESTEAEDGITQHYLVRCGVKGDGSFLKSFNQQVIRMEVFGGLKGADQSL